MLLKMKTEKKTEKKTKKTEKQSIKKSKTVLFWEKYPDGLFIINDMKAVLK